MKTMVVAGILLAFVSGNAYGQSVDEIVLPAGMFAKDWDATVRESGGIAGTGKQHGTYKFPADGIGAIVGITTSLPDSWVGEEIDIVFGGSAGGLGSGQYRIIGNVENTTIGVTATLQAEDGGTDEVVVVSAMRCPSDGSA